MDRCKNCNEELCWDANFCPECGCRVVRDQMTSVGEIHRIVKEAYKRNDAELHVHRQNGGKTVVIVATFA